MSSRRGRLLSGGDDVTCQLAAVASQGRSEPRDPHHAEYAKSPATDHRADRAEHLGGEPRFEFTQLGPPMKNTMFTLLMRPRISFGVFRWRMT